MQPGQFPVSHGEILYNIYHGGLLETLISDPTSDQYTVDALAQMAGFSNRKTFHSAFVRTTGLTSSEFRRNRGVINIPIPK